MQLEFTTDRWMALGVATPDTISMSLEVVTEVDNAEEPDFVEKRRRDEPWRKTRKRDRIK